MNRRAKVSKPFFICALILLALLFTGLWTRFSTRPEQAGEPVAAPMTNAAVSPAPVTNSTVSAVVPLPSTNLPATQSPSRSPATEFSWFQLHPFPASQTNGPYEWTVEDGKGTNVIRQLAHNELEYRRMVIENSTIYQRQLVYHTEPFTLLAQQAVQSGQSIQQITLPGLDGQTLQAVVTRADLREGGSQGQFYGQLPGRLDSMVTVAFVNDREAFTVISPQDQLYLQAEAREPGEIVVKRINPGTYGMLQP